MQISHDPDAGRFSVSEDGKEIGYLTYSVDGGVLNITHTVVDPEMRGRGIARELVKACKAFADGEGYRTIADCSYAAHVLGIDGPNPSCRIRIASSLPRRRPGGRAPASL